MNFFSKKNKDDKKSSFKMPSMGNMSLGQSRFKGSGATLGGSRPGTLVEITFPSPGSLNCSIEKEASGGAVVSSVSPGQAQEAGLLRGDVICWHGSGGEEASFEEFMSIVKSGERPLTVEILRIATGPQVTSASAGADARKAAMIAAADARETASKKKTLPRSAAKRAIDMDRNTKTYDHTQTSADPQTEEARRAVAAAKASEQKMVQDLGYNPFETVKSSSCNKPAARDTSASVTAGAPSTGPGQVAMPTFPNQDDDAEIPDDFTLALMQVVSQEDKAAVALNTMHKLISNAVTKGQTEGGEKFRTIRIGNEAIQKRVLCVEGAMELLVAAGFVASAGEESLLVYPLTVPAPWLESGLKIVDNQAGGA